MKKFLFVCCMMAVAMTASAQFTVFRSIYSTPQQSAGAIRRPTWAEFISEFGSKLASKASLSGYTDPTKDKYDDDPQFWAMVEDFRRMIRN